VNEQGVKENHYANERGKEVRSEQKGEKKCVRDEGEPESRVHECVS